MTKLIFQEVRRAQASLDTMNARLGRIEHILGQDQRKRDKTRIEALAHALDTMIERDPAFGARDGDTFIRAVRDSIDE